MALAAVLRVRQQQGAAFSLIKVSFNCNQVFGLVNLERSVVRVLGEHNFVRAHPYIVI